jgi:hypothetical protein
VQKIKNKIILSIILLSSTFTLNGHDFLHNHESETNNQCYSCLLSLSLISDECDFGNLLILSIYPEFTLQLLYDTTLFNPEYKNVSDRAPPIS